MTTNYYRMSELLTLAQCERKYHFQYVEGLIDGAVRAPTVGRDAEIPETNQDIRNIGTAAHSGVQWFLEDGSSLPEAIRSEARCQGLLLGLDETSLGLVDSMVERYAAECKKWWDGLEIYATEQRLVDEETGVHSQPDVLWITRNHSQRRDGIRGITDIKTSNPFFHVARNDFQLLTGAWLDRKLNAPDYRGSYIAEIHQIRRIRPSNRSKPPYLKRDQFEFTAKMLDNHGEVLLRRAARAQALRDEDNALMAAPALGQQCRGCKYAEICPGVEDGDTLDDRLSAGYRQRKPFNPHDEES